MSLQQIPLSTSYSWPDTSNLPHFPGVQGRALRTKHSPSTGQERSNDAVFINCFDEENALVRRAIAGDAQALEQLFTVNTDRLRQIAFAILRNKEDAEDALQNAFLSACHKLSTFKGQSTFSTWLTSIVINSARMARRKNNSHAESSLDEILVTSPGCLKRQIRDRRDNPEQACAQAELRALVENRIQRLPRRLQTAFRIRTLGGLSVAESSALLGVQATTLKARVFRAQQHITKSLRLALRIRIPKSASRRGNRSRTRALTTRARLACNTGESRTTNVQSGF